MRNKLLISFCCALLFFFFISTVHVFADCGDVSQYAKTFSNSDGSCHASTGLGYNTSGGSYQCGPVACPGQSSPLPHGNTCIFSQSDGRCFAGYSDGTNGGYGGFNPDATEGSCHYNPSDNGTPIACPTTYTVKAVVKSDNVPLANIPLHVYDNGHEGQSGRIQTTDSNGMIVINSWSGDHMKIWADNSSTYSFDKTQSSPIDLEVNTDWACGSQIGTPISGEKPACVITATTLATSTPVPLTPTPTPTGPTATPTPILTTGDITLHFEAIDTNNTPPPGSQQHGSRNVVLFLYKDTGGNGIDFSTAMPTYIKTGTVDQVVDDQVQYNGNFRKRNFPLMGVTSGSYYILAKSKEGSLVEHVGNDPITIAAGVNNILVDVDNGNATDGAPTTPPFLRMGDIVTNCTGTNDPACTYNLINILDYSALKDCFGPAITSANCLNHQLANGHQYNIADLNDDGQVDGVDYTVLLKHFGQQGIGNTTQNGGKDH